MVSRERLTIIPHGVPYMTKLLRYFVSEDSIFLHLEHVQGEGTCGAPSTPEHWGAFLFSTPQKRMLSPEEGCSLIQMSGTDREPSLSEG